MLDESATSSPINLCQCTNEIAHLVMWDSWVDPVAEREIKLRGSQFVKAQAQRADMPHRKQALSAICHGALERNGEKAWRWY